MLTVPESAGLKVFLKPPVIWDPPTTPSTDRVSARTLATKSLLLPQPKLQSVSLDHEHTKLIGVWPSGLWTIVPGGEDADTVAVNLAYRDAERAVRAAAGDPQLIDQARRQAESVLRAFLAALGWEAEIRWDAIAVRGAHGQRGRFRGVHSPTGPTPLPVARRFFLAMPAARSQLFLRAHFVNCRSRLSQARGV